MNLNQVTLPATNVELAVAFYQKIGFELIVLALPHYARFNSIEGDSTFSVHKVDSAVSNGTIVYFETQQIDEVVAELIEKGIQFDKLPTDEDWGWREASLRDPDGNLIIIYYAGEYRQNPPWKYKKD